MNRILGKTLVFLVLLSLLSVDGLAAKCRNRISVLGGRTAILPGKVIDEIAELQEEMKKPKVQKAYEEILKNQGLEAHFNRFMEAIGRLTQDDLEGYGKGTELLWMAYRRPRDKKVDTLKQVCWVSGRPFLAWTFDLKIDGRVRRFVIPADCLNLAELPPKKTTPPACEVTATPRCGPEGAPASVAGDVKVTKGQGNEKGVLKILQGEKALHSVEIDRFPYTYDLAVPASGTYSVEATVKGQGASDAQCRTQVALCTSPPPSCESCEACKTPPTCKLHLTSEKGRVRVSTHGSIGEVGTPELSGYRLERQADGDWTANVPPGTYTATLVVKSSDPLPNCPSAHCQTTIEVEPPCKDCETDWLLRSFVLYTAAQGDREQGSFRATDGLTGVFQLKANQGLGAGFEAERLFKGDGSWKEAKLGWALGLEHTALDTVWVFDAPGRWTMDDDTISMLTLTSGLNFHWRNDRWDLHAGPVAAWIHSKDATYSEGSPKPGTFHARFDDAFAFGAGVGIDAFVGKCWGWTAGARYLKASLKSDDFEVDVDPLILKAGFVYHF